MWVDHDMLTEAANIALQDPKLLAMMSDWNNSKDYGEQDMMLCSIMNYVKDLKASGFVLKELDEDCLDVPVLDIEPLDSRDYEEGDCSGDCASCECDSEE